MTTSLTRDRLDGQLLLPGDDGYDTARTVWNAMVDRHPRMIIRAASVRDVVTAVRTARDLDLDIGVRCGGHSAQGTAVPDDGLMIDLTPMGNATVDPRRRRAHVQGGALLGALDRAAQHHGLATTAGNVSHTGVGGLTLGGGMGWLARQYGLACDNVESYQVVTATGDILRASRTEHPDLYFGLRGGGGNFGIVTAFEFRLHPTGTQALLAEFTFSRDEAREVLQGWRDLNASAPRQATFTADINEETVTVGLVWAGRHIRRARPLLRDLRALGHPLSQSVTPMTYLTLQTKDDKVGGHHYRRYGKGHYLRQLPDAAIDAMLNAPLPNGMQAYGGAIADIPDDDAAFSHRHTMFEWGTGARWTDPTEDTDRITLARHTGNAIAPYANGVYVNSLGDEGQEGIQRAYPTHKLTKLTTIKNTYDPHNTFHHNQNIQPTT